MSLMQALPSLANNLMLLAQKKHDTQDEIICITTLQISNHIQKTRHLPI